jgi:2-keto-4-pentenoate hydratase/2-oxohepta-3-ene-1,7-dioic acid hydratase in catechol pathway
VNGQARQSADLKELIWNVNETIEHLSAAWTLQPGDLIYSGTPAGVARWSRGDVMEGSHRRPAVVARGRSLNRGGHRWSSTTTFAPARRTGCASRWP